MRDALYQNPIWQFELTVDGMDLIERPMPTRGKFAAKPHGLLPPKSGAVFEPSSTPTRPTTLLAVRIGRLINPVPDAALG